MTTEVKAGGGGTAGAPASFSDGRLSLFPASLSLDRPPKGGSTVEVVGAPSKCAGQEHVNNHSSSPPPSSSLAMDSSETDRNAFGNNGGVGQRYLTIETDVDYSSLNLLELAADNDADCFRRVLARDPAAVDEAGIWYARRRGGDPARGMVLQQRTPLMVAATYGSLDVMRLILAVGPAVDINRSCFPDGSTALHCAASGGSPDAVEAVRLLLAAGADVAAVDSAGHRPLDVVVSPPKLQSQKLVLSKLLAAAVDEPDCLTMAMAANSSSGSESPPLSSSPDFYNGSSMNGGVSAAAAASEKKEYPIDPSMPDIKNSVYASDEFRMFSFKVRPCSRAYSHDWTECPFVHPGENARRRDPRKYHYSCVPCPDFRKGACRRGDLCEYAHGVFECWLHPAQYRTRLCKDGTGCSRRVCFFAHTTDELRPLYVSTGSAVPSPRSSTSAMEMAAAAMGLIPGSPSSVSVMSPSPFTPPMSPSATNGMGHGVWAQPSVPTLHLPGSNLQSSRLRSSLSARDIPPEDLALMQDFEAAMNDFNCFSSPHPRLSSVATSNRAARSIALTPSNLDELFTAAEISSSPRYADQAGSLFSPTHKSAILTQFQQQQQSMLSPINTNVFSPKGAIDQHGLLQASLGLPSPGRMSPRSVDSMAPMGSRVAALTQREKQQQMRSLSARDLGSGSGGGLASAHPIGSPVSNNSHGNLWSKWASPTGKVDWGLNGDDLHQLKRSSSFELGINGEEPDLSWVQSLVKESPPELKLKSAATPGPNMMGGGSSTALTTPTTTGTLTAKGSGECTANSAQLDEAIDHAVLGAWLE